MVFYIVEMNLKQAKVMGVKILGNSIFTIQTTSMSIGGSHQWVRGRSRFQICKITENFPLFNFFYSMHNNVIFTKKH